MTDALLQDLLEHVRSRYYGKYRGVVVDVDAATMRVKASVPSVLGGVTSGWASPCVPYAGPQVGFMMLPDVGSGVWIEFEGGDVSFPIWTGCYWNSGDIPSSAASTLKTIIASAGSLAFDNNASSVTLQDSSQNSLVLDSSGATTTAGGGTGTVAVGSSGVSVNNGALEVM
ncbi:MAG TPA: phage baseplate assembly protein V [Stellaceae bacterium]|nr:phage baseplate assembly protein V [Stellaceae bacterium]